MAQKMKPTFILFLNWHRGLAVPALKTKRTIWGIHCAIGTIVKEYLLCPLGAKGHN